MLYWALVFFVVAAQWQQSSTSAASPRSPLLRVAQVLFYMLSCNLLLVSLILGFTGRRRTPWQPRPWTSGR